VFSERLNRVDHSIIFTSDFAVNISIVVNTRKI